ncbi:patatin-like phospholipase family protein [Salipiger mucosus]|uniref:Ferredoxin reductase n=1 Tax=Salipiger mucosus DSM 16094 TaxID=1123237 RepID=S9Q8Q6_9RHOB|nr:patatin-like phospholipase family protein [Salipiger mucosus]EPX76402.1 Ferredoxin reductase [Salipiger mucosus DSM 16094]
MRKRGSRRTPLRLKLALQGGGAHGAFTWGVLDRLLEEDWIDISAISGTSAGAMNAAALTSGLATGGRDGARETLEAFWRKIGSYGPANADVHSLLELVLSPLRPDRMLPRSVVSQSARVISPYDANPLGFNPLQLVLEETLDIEAIRSWPLTLYVTATHVRTGEARVFSGKEISVAVLLASACLPSLFHAIEIDGELYWDGGYTGNPSMMPLVADAEPYDILLVQVSPIERPSVPRNALAIADREKEIAFNAPLIRDLRTIAELQHQARSRSSTDSRARSWTRRSRLRSIARHSSILSQRFHRIASSSMSDRDGSSKMNVDWEFLTTLRDEGRHTAGDFLSRHGDDIGRRGSLDLPSSYHRNSRHLGIAG